MSLPVLVRDLTVPTFHAHQRIYAVGLTTVLRTAGPREQDVSPKVWTHPLCCQDSTDTKGRTGTFRIIYERYASTSTAHGLMPMTFLSALNRRRNVVLRKDLILLNQVAIWTSFRCMLTLSRHQ